MGASLCCSEQANMRPGYIRGIQQDKINIIGFALNADSRALQLYCLISQLEFEYIEVNMLKGEHKTDEFVAAHPSMHLPILQDGAHSVYGSTLIQMMHICNRYQTSVDMDRMNMRANQAKCNQFFANFDQRVRPVTKRIRSMLFAKKFFLKPEPTQE